ncbi:ATP-dependent helicase [Winogradskyella sediminis]|uniref:ATP-dependent helicase n=1 Tax=Winogradskyella sediminis TaxID=1382466 RepID=UPI003AA8F22B
MPIHNLPVFKTNLKLLKGNVQIIACAGSGKTEFVSERIAYQIQQGIAKPSEIVALTFNEAAAEELKFRVRDKITELMGKQPDIGDMYIGTIHAFAFKILQDFVPKYRGYDMLDENSRKAFTVSLKWKDGINIPALYRYLKNRGFKYNGYFAMNNPSYWENWTLGTFLSDVDFCREESITSVKMASETFKSSYQVYLDKLNERKFLDFSGILTLAVHHLENDPFIVQQIQKQFKFFTIDEYQDVNPIQEKLIRLVSGKKNVCVVGDDDQSIYQWRGADVKNIINFNKNYNAVTTHTLTTNRRSHDNIINCASNFIATNTVRIPKQILPNNAVTEQGDLYKLCFDAQQEEVDWIVEKVQNLYGKEYLDKGEPRKLKYSDMVLLFRRRADAAEYKNALESAGINVIYSGMGGLMEADEVNAILRILRYIGESVKEDDNEPNDSLYDIHEAIELTFTIKFTDFKKAINELISWCEKQKRLSFQELYYKLLSKLGLDEISFHDDSADDVVLYNLGRFSQTIADFESSRTYLSKNDIIRFVDFINTFVSNSYDEGSTNANEGLIDAVKIMTLHGTKGLGFPAVFIPSLKATRANNNPRITFLDSAQIDFSRYDGSIDDERRLYYVAVTRAKKYLFVTSHRIKTGNKRATGLHPFFTELQDNHFITTSISDPTIRNTCEIERVDSDLRFPTNYSQLSYYMSCSYDYRIRFIYGFNPELVQALGYGKQVHNLINLMHTNYERNGKIPTEKEVQKLVDEHFYLRYAATKQEDMLRKACFNSLKNYIELWKNDFSLAVKTEQNFEMDFENKALINGSIDLLSRADGQKDVLEIIDFKTGKPQSHYEEKYTHQVVLYTIAAQEALQKNINKAYLHYLDAEKAERKEVIITPNKIAETKAQLSSAIDGIVSNKFPRKPEKQVCSKCDWDSICPKSK